MTIKELVSCCVNMVLPTSCASCGIHPSEYPFAICSSCLNLILTGDKVPLQRLDHISKIWSCRWYESPLRDCIKKFKYNGKRQLLPVFEQVIRRCLAVSDLPLGSIDLVIPVPLHPARRRSRGFNQSDLIARILSEEFSLPVSSHILIKTKNSAPQICLPRTDRIKNPADSFAAIDRAGISGKTVLLVDDVVTTGATLEACARELIRTGAKEVFAFTLARTL